MATVECLWLVDFDSGAVADLEEVKSRADRRAVFSAIAKLQSFGPGLPSPFMKSLKGEADLFELRPRQGACAVRPIYARDRRQFIVLAVAPNKPGFDKALGRAKQRLSQRRA